MIIDWSIGALVTPLLLGVVLGWVGGLFGIGGGIIAIPILALGFGMSQQLAQGTALVMITPNVLMAFVRYHQRNALPLRSITLMGIAALASTWPAAWLAIHIDSRSLMIGFAIFLIGLSLYLMASNRQAAQAEASSSAWNDRWMPGVGVLSGLVSGLFSVGAGIIASPLLVRFFGKRQAVAQGIALAVVVPGAMMSLSIYESAHMVNWQTGLLLALGGLISVSHGVAIAHRLPDRKLRNLFAVMLLVTALLLLRTGVVG